MERRLLGLAVLTFIIEMGLFLVDMGWITVPGFSPREGGVNHSTIGEVVAARQFVRRRGYDSNIWEDSSARETLFENDSILTLNGSSAKLKLRGDVNLELHENTLVVLEPVEDNLQEPFRLRFSRGDIRSHGGTQGFSLKSGEWTIRAKPGTDLSVRAVDSQQVEVDVTSGGVDVVHSISGQSASVAADQRLTLLPEEVGELVTTSDQIGWIDARPLRLYAHKFPVQVPLIWHGKAEELDVSSPGHGHTRVPLPSDSDRTTLPLGIGNFHLSLRRGSQVSQALPVEVLPAPKLVYLTPLPRDRVQTGQPLLYSWLSETPLAGYRIDFSREPEGQSLVHQASTSIPKATTALPVSGSLHWRVTGFDEDGFIIPASHSYPIFSVPDPLSPPQLRAPSADESASVSPPRRLPRGWALWALLIAVAEGQSLPPVIFNWDNLSGADYYLIEISLTEDFRNPVIVAKTSTNFYAWSRFKKGIYYYRVAGGSNSGRMGLFTAPTRVDLTIWPPPRQQKAQIATTLPPKLPGSKQEPIPESTAIPPLPSDLPPPAPIPPRPFEFVGPIPRLPEVFPDRRGTFWMRGLYRVAEENSSERVTTKVSGGTVKALGVEVKSPLSGLPISFQAEFAQFDWQPRSKTQLPFQRNVTTDDWGLTGWWRETYSRWHFGVSLASQGHFERATLESVLVKDQFTGGFALRYSYHTHGGDVIHEGRMLIGQSTWDVESRNRFIYPLSRRLFLGIEANLRLGLKDHKGQSTEGGINLGFSF